MNSRADSRSVEEIDIENFSNIVSFRKNRSGVRPVLAKHILTSKTKITATDKKTW